MNCWIYVDGLRQKKSNSSAYAWQLCLLCINSLRPKPNGRLFADDTFKCIFLNESIRIVTENSLKFVPKGLINNIPALVQIMAWRRPGDKPLSEPMLVRSLTHICVTRPQWVKPLIWYNTGCGNRYFTTKSAAISLVSSRVDLRW